MSPHEQQARLALAGAQDKRMEIARLRNEMLRNPDEVCRALTEPPEVLHGVTVAEIIGWARHKGMRSKSMEMVGRMAARDGVNLFVPLGRASARTRGWAVEHGMFRVHRARSDRKPRTVERLREVA